MIAQLAAQLRLAQETKTPCRPLRHLIGVEDIDLAYRVQEWNNQRLIEGGATPVGRKIGLTSKAVQQQLGVAQPDFGLLLDTMEVQTGAVLSVADFLQPKVETEIALVLKKDLPERKVTTTELLAAIDYAVIALEIVDSRIENWDIKITDTIADNASSAAFVLGHKPVPISRFDMTQASMQLWCEGDVVSQGRGAACMGSPLNALLWLANTMAALESPLREGEVILTGALGPMHTVKAGYKYNTWVQGLGSVELSWE
jgi:2-keto-4-pentenoate hydratase